MMDYWKNRRTEEWLPTTRKELALRDWDSLDVILFSGDAYVDHPAFGAAVIGRILEAQGLRVAIVPQPNWQDDLRDFKKLGKPRLFFGVTAGNMDSMVNHYTAGRRRRSNDAYTPGNQSGFRPDYPTIVYTQILKKLFPEVPVIIGGIEASLRRLTHYDYWQDKLKASFLVETGADMLVYGMGEQAISEIASYMNKGIPLSNLINIRQTVFLRPKSEPYKKQKQWQDLVLYSHEDCLSDALLYAKNFRYIEEESNKLKARRIIQECNEHRIIVNPPFPPMTEDEMDRSFDLPYTRLPHPKYKNRGAIPAYEMIKFSVNSHRGCFGGCSFCTISAHQGKFIASRSEQSILKEVEEVSQLPGFTGHISDIGGPSANMYKMKGKREEICNNCKRPSCIYPKVCSNLDVSHDPMNKLYAQIRNTPGVKKATIGSGIRYDLFYNEKGEMPPDRLTYARELIKHHVSGRLKVAPEHTSDEVLKMMRKPSFDLFYKLKSFFDKVNKEEGLKQQLIPYFISSHPGSHNSDMADLAAKTKRLNFQLEQVQDFTPTPMTVATVIYYSGYHPYTLEKVYTARNSKEKKEQQQFFFWYKNEYRRQIRQSLLSLGRADLAEELLEQNQQHNFQKRKSAKKKVNRK